MLGQCYSSGEGVKTDRNEAIKWFQMAADQGNIRAQFMLGETYSMRGADMNLAMAVFWYRKAADKGFEPAKKALAELERQT